MDEKLLEKLGTYYVYFRIGEQFGYTFEQYLIKYINNPTACTVHQLKKKAATIAVVTA